MNVYTLCKLWYEGRVAVYVDMTCLGLQCRFTRHFAKEEVQTDSKYSNAIHNLYYL